MSGEFKRLYVGNVPPGVTEKDLENEFSSYGQVQKVELKKKENLVDPNNPLIFGFISINIADKSLRLCLDEFSSQKYRGQYLNVSVARESFLDRLKREREESSGSSAPKAGGQEENNRAPSQKAVTELPKIIKVDSSSSSESSESDEDERETAPTVTKLTTSKPMDNKQDDDHTDFIAKKKASSSLLFGKIKIQSTSNEPLHVISKNQNNIKHLDEQAKKADQKRKESLHKMKNQYNQQKLAIQQALAEVDTNKRKRIVFDDEEIVNEEASKNNQQKKKKLFEDDGENDEEVNKYQKDFEVKTEFLSKGGDKLMKLQSKYKLDQRFQLDERFIENEDDDEEKAIDSKEVSDERSWQLGIIEQVVGRKFETLSGPQKKKLRKTMLRFDPAKEEHQKFLQNVEKVSQTFINDKRRKEESNAVEVSKDTFYSVNVDLTTSLKNRGDGFSLISMFGKVDEDSEKKIGDHENVYKEKVLPAGKEKGFFNNAFKYDSSDTEDDGELDSNAVTKTKQIVEENQKAARTAKQGIRVETLFFFKGDERLKEGKAFFKLAKTKDGEIEDYDKVKDRLKQIINKKIVKTRKNNYKFKNKNNFKKK